MHPPGGFPRHLLRYPFQGYDDQTIRMVDLRQFDLDGKTIKLLNTKSQQPIVDMSAQVK
jgi:choloylglycine hydrolase